MADINSTYAIPEHSLDVMAFSYNMTIHVIAIPEHSLDVIAVSYNMTIYALCFSFLIRTFGRYEIPFRSLCYMFLTE
jgi:hypothetical protein